MKRGSTRLKHGLLREAPGWAPGTWHPAANARGAATQQEGSSAAAGSSTHPDPGHVAACRPAFERQARREKREPDLPGPGALRPPS